MLPTGHAANFIFMLHESLMHIIIIIIIIIIIFNKETC